MVESSQNENIEILTYSEVEEVGGYIGNFDVKIRKKARFVDIDKCTGCGTCYQKCPVKVPSEFDMEMGMRKAIYVPFPQAVPNVPVIDKEHCRMFTKGKCSICQKLCQADAVDYEQKDEIIEDRFGAIVVATGYDLFDASVYGEYGGGRFKDVITGLQLERLISPAGPTGGHIKRPSDGKEPKNVVFIQCVGSRDIEKGVPYCSNVCCMYTAKQAVLLKEHLPEVQTNIFYMDIRSAGKNYEQFVQRTIEQYGALYIRGRVSKIYQRGDKLIVKGADTLVGIQVEVEADMVVLATGITPRHDSKNLAGILSIPYDQFGFFTELHPKLAPIETVTSGIFLTGACQAPKDIPDTVASASGAAAKVASLFSSDEMSMEPLVSTIDTAVCSMCKACVEVCPYGAIQEEEITLRDGTKKKQLIVLESVCHGCGACVSTCRSSCIMLRGMTDEQIFDELMAVAQ
jgi:heterodisulfide reductase subunit A